MLKKWLFNDTLQPMQGVNEGSVRSPKAGQVGGRGARVVREDVRGARRSAKRKESTRWEGNATVTTGMKKGSWATRAALGQGLRKGALRPDLSRYTFSFWLGYQDVNVNYEAQQELHGTVQVSKPCPKCRTLTCTSSCTYPPPASWSCKRLISQAVAA